MIPRRTASLSDYGCELVWRFDRFARSTRHLSVALERFDHRGIQLISARDHINTDSSMGRAMFTMTRNQARTSQLG